VNVALLENLALQRAAEPFVGAWREAARRWEMEGRPDREIEAPAATHSARAG
jgi:hypothetical protein